MIILIPNTILCSFAALQNNLEHVEGCTVARTPINGEENEKGKARSVVEDSTAAGVTLDSERKERDYNSSRCVTEEESSQRRRRTSIIEENSCSLSCGKQDEEYVPGGASMLGAIDGAVLDTIATAHEEREGGPPSGVGTPLLEWKPIGRIVDEGGEKANVNHSESIYGDGRTPAPPPEGRITQAPLFQGPSRANPQNIGGGMQGLLLHDTAATSLLETTLSNDNDALSHRIDVLHPSAETTSKAPPDRTEPLKRPPSPTEAAQVEVGFVCPAAASVPSTSTPRPMPPMPVKGSAFAAVSAGDISVVGEAPPESCELRPENCCRQEPFCRTSCDAWPVVDAHRPCLVGSTASSSSSSSSSVPEEAVDVLLLHAAEVSTTAVQ